MTCFICPVKMENEFNLHEAVNKIPAGQLQLAFLKEFVFKYRKELGISIEVFKEEYFKVKDNMLSG
jgi:hypothetical protein